MKIRRHKHTKRIIKYYRANFNLDTKSFNVLIDGTFAHEALNTKVNLAEQLPKFFDVKENKCKLFTTRCAIHETEMLGKPTYGAMLILKQYNLVPCTHKRNFISTEKCFKHLLSECAKNNSPIRYFVATQSESMKEIVRSTPGTPLMIISHNAINLEKPSNTSNSKADEKIQNKLKPNDLEIEKIKKLKQKLLDDKNGVKRIHRKRKAKGPNPLSCKKSKKKPNLKEKSSKT